MSDYQVQPSTIWTGDQQEVLIAEADNRTRMPLQLARDFASRDYKVHIRDGAGGSENLMVHDATNEGIPGDVVLAAGGNRDLRIQVTDYAGRPLVGTAGLSAAEQADGRTINPRVVIIAPRDLTVTQEAGAPASQTLTRLSGAAVPRTDTEEGYLGTCGLGLDNGAGIDLSAVRGLLHLNFARAAGSTGTLSVYLFVVESPTKAMALGVLRFPAA